MLGKRNRQTPQWTISLEDASTLRSAVVAVATVVARIKFEVSKNKSGNGYVINFEGRDPAMTCVVLAKLCVDNVVFSKPEDACDDFCFCVDCTQLQVALDAPSCARGLLVMEGHADASIQLRIQDPEQRSHVERSVLNTYVIEHEERQQLNDLGFEIRIEMDVSRLREIIKKAHKIHAEHLRIQVYLRTVKAKQYSLVVFSIKGESYHCQCYLHEPSRDEDGSMRVRAVADGEDDWEEPDDDPVFEGVYYRDKIDAFVKILPCRVVLAVVKQGMPLMMTHRLAGGMVATSDTSEIRFLIAPINEND